MAILATVAGQTYQFMIREDEEDNGILCCRSNVHEFWRDAFRYFSVHHKDGNWTTAELHAIMDELSERTK